MNRQLKWLTSPARRPFRPFLPLVRRTESGLDLGVLFDARHARLTGFSATVFQVNFFLIPAKLSDLLTLPRKTFDTAEEVLAAGWRIDDSADGDET